MAVHSLGEGRSFLLFESQQQPCKPCTLPATGGGKGGGCEHKSDGCRRQRPKLAGHQTSNDTATAETTVPIRHPQAAGLAPLENKIGGGWAARSSSAEVKEDHSEACQASSSFSSVQSAGKRRRIGSVKGVSGDQNLGSGYYPATGRIGKKTAAAGLRWWSGRRMCQSQPLAGARLWRIKQLRARVTCGSGNTNVSGNGMGSGSCNSSSSGAGGSSGSVGSADSRDSSAARVGCGNNGNSAGISSSSSSSSSRSRRGGSFHSHLVAPPGAEQPLYCPWNKCLDERIALLQQRALAGDGDAERALDSCAQACAWLRRCFPCCRDGWDSMEAGSSQASREAGTARMVLVCYCGLPEHDLRLVKRNYFPQFSSICRPPAFITPHCAPPGAGGGARSGSDKASFDGRSAWKRQRGSGGDDNEGNGGDACACAQQHARGSCWRAAPRLSMQSILPMLPMPGDPAAAAGQRLQRPGHDPPRACVPVQVIEEQLPDLGVFIRAALHQSFFGAQLLKSNQKAWDNLVHRDSSRKGSRSARTGEAVLEASSGPGGAEALDGEEMAPWPRQEEEDKVEAAGAQTPSVAPLSGRASAARAKGSAETWRTSESKLQPPLLQPIGETLCSVLILESVHVLRKFMKTHRSIKLPTRFDRLLSTASSPSSWSLPHSPQGVLSLNRELDLCIRVVMSSLLKLMPLGCKRPTFLGRVALWSRFVSLLGAEASAKSAFVQTHLSLVKSCFCEYVLNMLVHSMPCELEALLPSEALSSRQYVSAVVAMCDNLRQDCLVTGAESWADLDRDARKRMDKCTRAVKFPLGYASWQHQQAARGRHPLQPFLLETSLDPAKRMQSLGSAVLDSNGSEAVHSCVRVFPLPGAAIAMQGETLEDLHSMCFVRSGMARRIMLCLWCAITGKKIKTKLRVCCRTGTYSCDVCGAADVLCINMHGVLLKISGVAYYLCPCCGQLRMWEGAGEDLCPHLSLFADAAASSLSAAAGVLPWDNAWGDEQGRGARLARRRAVLLAADPAESGRCAIPTRPLPHFCGQWHSHQAASPRCRLSQQANPLLQQPEAVSKCLVCGCKSQPRATMMLPDVHRMVMVRCSFCIKHSLPMHARRCIQNTLALEKFLKDLYYDGSGHVSDAARPRSKKQQHHQHQRAESSTGGSLGAPGPLF